MNVSVVIPARNEEKNLPRCLAALARQTYGDFELIVVDSASSDGTGRVARDHGARVIRVEVPGVALARQVGFEAARGEIIASMDADTIAPPDWLARLIAPLSDPQVVETVGGLVYEGQNLIPSLIDSVWQRSLHRLGLTTATAANLAVRKTAFEQVGGFYLPNGDFPRGYPELEAMWLGMKLRHVGKIVLLPRLRVITSPRRIKNPKMAYWWSLGYLRKAGRFGYWELTGRSLHIKDSAAGKTR